MIGDGDIIGDSINSTPYGAVLPQNSSRPQIVLLLKWEVQTIALKEYLLKKYGSLMQQLKTDKLTISGLSPSSTRFKLDE